MGNAATIDWSAIREEWERTDVSDRELAKRWGFASDNSIRRRRTREGWTRSEASVTAGLAERALGIEIVGLRDPHEPPRVRTPEPPAEEEQEADVGGVRGGVREDVRMPVTRTPAAIGVRRNPATAGEVPAPVRTGGPESPPSLAEQTGRSYVREEDEGTADSLVDERARVTRRQLYEARRGIKTATMFFDLLHAIATAEMGSEEHMEARTRLQSINMEKDTLSTLIKSMTGMFESCTKIERQILGLDQGPSRAGGPMARGLGAADPVGPGAAGGRITQEMRAALESLPEELLMGFRTHAIDNSKRRVPVQTIEGHVEKESDAS